jgi:Glycosyltransferase family 87
MWGGVFSIYSISRPGRHEWRIIAFVIILTLLFLPMVMWKTIGLEQGDTQVFFRAGWAVWTGYPLYEITDHHGWTYHYPPTFALFMGPFADPPPGHAHPWWSLPFPAAVMVWYFINVLCLMLALHVWANAVEPWRPTKARAGLVQGPWLLRFGPLLALLPFIGDGLVRGQPTAILLFLVVVFLALYVEKRAAWASFAFALAVAIKVFPLVLAILPLLRRDWKFLGYAAAWCVVLLVGLPALCLGPTATFDLYRILYSEHLAGIVSGAMSAKIASEVSPGAYSGIGIGSVVARIAAGKAFYSSPLPPWASIVQFAFNVTVLAAVAVLGRGGFWHLRGAQPAAGYLLLVAGAVLLAAIPLMIPFAGSPYVTTAVPLMAVAMIEIWRRTGEEVVTATMVGWSAVAWLSMVASEVAWDWLRLAGPMTWALLLLAPPSLLLMARLSVGSTAASVPEPAALRSRPFSGR